MNKSLIFVYWGGFMLEAIVFDTYKVEYEDNAIHVTFGDNIKCTKEDLDKVDISYYELQNVQIEFEEGMQYEFVVLKDSYLQGKNRYQVASKPGQAISIFWL